MKIFIFLLLLQIILCFITIQGCQFYPSGEYLRFVRVPENLTVGSEVLKVEVHPRKNLSIKSVDKDGDISYFTYKDVNRTTVKLILARPLEDLVDSENPQNVLKFRLVCDYNDGEDTISSYLSVTVYVEDINDHSPIFINAPYEVSVDELTPVGANVFRSIRALDEDKPNTPNSEIQYSIVGGNERGRFALDSSHKPILQVRRALDYDAGDREFILTIQASDRGVPPRSTNTTIKITINDNDDLPPKFTKGVYRTRITEFYPITGKKIHQPLKFDSPIYAFDQDIAIDSQIRYDIIAGNERNLFYLDTSNGTLYLEREIDLDQERSLPGNTFVLQIQASQVDNPLRTGVARVEVEIMDLNDNLPEFEVDFYNISIVENLPNGFSVLQVIATDQDQGDNGEFTYILQDNVNAFSLDQRTGWLTVRDQSQLDRETNTILHLNVTAKEKTPSVVQIKDGFPGSSSVSIVVTLLDANDNNPTFVPNNLYEFMISSDSKIGDIVGTVKAVDPDLGRNGIVLYDVQKTANSSSPRTNNFIVEPKTGRVVVNETPLPEGRHALFIEASDQPANPSERRYSLAVVTIEVTNPGKREFEMPDFVGAPYEFWVGGNVGIGTSVGQIRVNDALNKKTTTYDLLHSYPEGVPFAVEEKSGVITVVDDLPKFDRNLYDFEAVVTDEKTITLVTNVTVHVVDPQDEKGILMKGAGSSPIEFHVKENKVNAVIGQLLHKNVTVTKSLRFIIANHQDVTDDIAITNEGTLFTQKPLDREKRDIYRLTIIAQYNRGVISGAGIYQVTVYVDDENDNAPVFERTSYEGSIKENCISGTEVDLQYPIKATDADLGVNSHFSIAIFGEGGEMFRIDKNTGKIYFNSADTPLDREEKSVYTLKLMASDKGGLVSEANLRIVVLDENDNNPVFLQMIIIPDQGVEVVEYDQKRSEIALVDNKNANISSDIISTTLLNMRKRGHEKTVAPLLALPEDLQIGTSFLRLIADDKDQGDNAQIRYEMVSETFIPNEQFHSNSPHTMHYFMVHPTNGEVSTARILPPESEFRLNISAIDGGDLQDNVVIRIFVRDINNHAPVFKKSFYNFDVEEAQYSRKTILGKIEATDLDFGQNANISYQISSDYERLPFAISEYTGVLSVNGELDREKMDKYSFKVIAKDNSDSNQLSSSVDVDINVLDINDHPPKFYGYDEIISVKFTNEDYPNHNYNSVVDIPVYHANVVENSPIGTPITRVFANDSDFSGNGNGLFLFNIPQRKNQENLFSVDSKDGVVTTIAKLDFEHMSTHNITVIASDLGSPSLSSTAMIYVTVIDVPDEPTGEEKQIFSHRYYEVEVEENIEVPVQLLTLNLSDAYQPHRLRFTIVPDGDKEIARMFKVQPRNGTVYITETPDREKRDRYEFKIRLDRIKFGRGMPVMVYPITSEKLTGLAPNEVKVIVKITDLNDNVPKFTYSGKPIVAALPSSANYGYHILKLQAKDPDLGINGDVRYQILSRADDESHRFAIDPITGQVRAVANFARDAGKVFGFDVKATDRRGADDGKSAIANVFVYVIDERKQLVMVLDSKPTDVENDMENITQALYNTTGFDIRVRKLEPHSEHNQIDYSATDMYIYAVDPQLNVIIDMDKLHKLLHTKQLELDQALEPHHVIEIASGLNEVAHSRSRRFLLSTLEVGVVVLGCIVFVGALATAICISCVKRNKRKQQKKYPKSQFTSYAFAADSHMKPALFPSYVDGIHYAEPSEPFMIKPVAETQSHASVHHGQTGHDKTCSRYDGRRQSRNRLAALETSITSLHSSGKDSGIVDGVDVMRCQCGNSSSHSSEDSSNSSYEDSLKSIPHQRKKDPPLRRLASLRRVSQLNPRIRRSFAEEMLHESSIVRTRIPRHHASMDRLSAPTTCAGISNRASGRRVMSCQLSS